LDEIELIGAYQYAWEWGNQMLATLAVSYEFNHQTVLIEKLSHRFKFNP
jgi:hypothetical protein